MERPGKIQAAALAATIFFAGSVSAPIAAEAAAAALACNCEAGHSKKGN